MSELTDEQRYQLLLVDAICGVGFPSITLAAECQRVGMAEFTGNQWNPDWKWDRKALRKLPHQTLQELYEGLCEQREENMQPKAPLDDVPEPSSIILQ